jgi:hypothetical protein
MPGILDLLGDQAADVVVRQAGVSGDLRPVTGLEPFNDFLMGHSPNLNINAQSMSSKRRTHMHVRFAQNVGVQKKPIRQVVKENLEALMKAHGDGTNNSAAGRRCKTAHTNIARIRDMDVGTSVDMLQTIADGYGIQPWELLVDGKEAREAAFRKMVSWGGSSPLPDEAPNKDKPGKGARSKKVERDEPAPPPPL